MNDVNVYRGTPEELPAQWRKRAERKRLCGLPKEAELDEAHANELEAALALQPARGDGAVDRKLIAWVGEVYPATEAEADGAVVTMTWDQFNAMREAIGRKPSKPSPRKVLIVGADHFAELDAHYEATAASPSAAVGGRVGEEPEERAPDCLECGATWKEAHQVDCSSNAANLP